MILGAQDAVLPNGLRVVTATMPQVESVAIGIWVGAGGRHEPEAISGISHFLEHMLFKGTRRRSARAISQTIEGRGGDINAFTQEESTCFYARVPVCHTWEAFDVLMDMYREPLLAPDDLKKERDVIIEEILMVRDQPQQQVDEMLGEALWRNHALGRPLTGSPETVGRLRRSDLVAFLASQYIPRDTVIAFAGNLDHESCVKRVQRYLPLRSAAARPRLRPVNARVAQRLLYVRQKDSEQAHVAMGFRLFGRHDRRRYALKLLSVVLGENMSSRLFQTVREQHGLAYAIQSGAHLFADTGVLMVSAGLDRNRLARAMTLIVREIGRIKAQAVSAAELRRARDYAIGQIRLGLEGTVSQMMWAGEHILSYGRVLTPEESIAELSRVTPGDLRALAEDILRPGRLSVAMVLPETGERVTGDIAGIVERV